MPGDVLSADMAHHSRIAGMVQVFDDLGNAVILASGIRIDEQLRQQAEDNKLNTGEQEKNVYQKERSIVNPPSLQSVDSELQ